jgi:glycosyltransferase involved in cell wall biosynthesis
MKHIIITRIKFDDNQLFEKYFDVMKNTYVPSINSQTNKNFEIGFIINENHIPIVSKLFDNQKINFFTSYDLAKKYCYDNNFELQTRHDCDDWMKEDYVNKIQEVYKEKINSFDNFIIHSKVTKLDFHTNDLYSHGINYDNFISMFLTLCQKKVNHFVYDENHRHMNKLTNNIFLLDGGYTRLVIHSNNIYSHISNSDKKIEVIKNYDLSIVIPTYKNVTYIEEMLNSIGNAKSNYSIEVLIGIDCCEETKNFVINNNKKFKDYINFYYFNSNLGPYIIRNSLAYIAKSDKILFVDSDDILHKDIFDETIKNLLTFDIIRFKFYNFLNNNDLKNFDKKNINSFHSIGQFGIKKNKFLELNGFEPWICAADSEFKNRSFANNLKIINTNKILYYRRRHTNSLTSNTNTNHTSKIRLDYNKIINQRVKEKNFKKLQALFTDTFYKIEKNGNLKLFYKKNNQNYNLSVIIPTYKNTQYIDECINSIIESSQNQNVEVLVGIDSCEETLKHIKTKSYPGFIKFYLFEKNIGPYIIRNTLSQLTNSEKLLFFDSDDIMEKNMIKNTIERLDKYEVVRLKYQDFNNNGPQKQISHEGVFAIDKKLFLSMNGFEPWVVAADSEFLIRLKRKNIQTHFTTDLQFKRRIHSQGLTSRRDTGIGSKLRESYSKLILNKKIYKDPDILNISNFVEVNSISTLPKLSEIKKPDLTKILNKQPRKIVENKVIKKEGKRLSPDISKLLSNNNQPVNMVKKENFYSDINPIKTQMDQTRQALINQKKEEKTNSNFFRKQNGGKFSR